ncbi:MAG: glycosyl hydrolase 2 galactose-binding domain-containing protein [Acutalibacteraceae bacterium]
MKTISLNGAWSLTYGSEEKVTIPATVPGLNIDDMISAGLIGDPALSASDKEYAFLCDFQGVYSKTFHLDFEDLKNEKAELTFKRIDTLARITLNGMTVAETDNVHRSYTFDVNDYLQEGENLLTVEFSSLKKYIDLKNSQFKLPYNAMGTTGHPHIRKAACSFGWDFAPELCPQGISGDCSLILRSEPLISRFEVRQEIKNGTGEIHCRASLSESTDGEKIVFTVTSPEGKQKRKTLSVSSGSGEYTFVLPEPALWWSNGLGEQPLYKVEAKIQSTGQKVQKRIGFRTITLDRSNDAAGSNFQFSVNGIRIFAKGANYIPMDAVYTRITRERLFSLLSECKNAGMNMIRVWGGGYYESDDFYDICDELGLLVWQDCAFACCAYPFNQPDYLENVKAEIRENVSRIKHHASLALWCGNNEIESISLGWVARTDIIQSTGDFFYRTLPELIGELDPDTPYHPCSPSSKEYMKLMNSDPWGDTHIWNVWHGYQPKSYFRTRKTRFCSEFGMQSYPHPTLVPHQKCDMGEERLRFYLAGEFACKGKEAYKSYFTQLIQMEYMKEAVEHFRRIGDICHGTLYWQLNDCWPAASWAAIDSDGNKKALLYHSAHFYEAVHISAHDKKGRIFVNITNERNEDFRGKVQLEVQSLRGLPTKKYELEVYVHAGKSEEVFALSLSDLRLPSDVLCMRVYAESGELLSENRRFFTANKNIRLENPELSFTLDGEKLTVKAKKYARYIYIDAPGLINSFSDNFFDLSAGEEKTVFLGAEPQNGIELFSLYDAMKGSDKKGDAAVRLKELSRPMAMMNIISRYFDK